MVVDPIYNYILVIAFVWAMVGFIVTQFIMQAPYGQHDNLGENHWRINERLGWFLMEAPAPIVFITCFLWHGIPTAVAAWVLFALWNLHYFHRAFIYPFRIHASKQTRIPVLVVAMGGLYCGTNGYLNGTWIGNYSVYNDVWLRDPRFILGCSLFLFGYFLNKQSDRILIQLRQPGETGYKIPYGGGFRFVSSPNYLGEILTWSGFAIACWSLAGLSFVVMTIANLVPRALTRHQWYLQTFAAYPKERRALIPYVL